MNIGKEKNVFYVYRTMNNNEKLKPYGVRVGRKLNEK